MSTRLRRGGWAALAAAALLLVRPGNAQAHPHLVGKWVGTAAPGLILAYDFGPPHYVSDGVWVGPFTFSVDGSPVSDGRYEIRMFTGAQGTLGLRDGTELELRVGVVDFGTRAMTLKSVTFRP
jgi:hypothetical protein